MKKITQEVIEKLAEEAAKLPRKRKNLNYHTNYSDTLQRMLNAMQPGTYIQPHRHKDPDKREVFILLSGKIAVIEFDDNGNITDHILLHRETGKHGIEVAPGIWHTLIVLEPNSVIFEIKDGPYSPIDDKNFASWAPEEGEEECAAFQDQLMKKLNLDK